MESKNNGKNVDEGCFSRAALWIEKEAAKGAKET